MAFDNKTVSLNFQRIKCTENEHEFLKRMRKRGITLCKLSINEREGEINLDK